MKAGIIWPIGSAAPLPNASPKSNAYERWSVDVPNDFKELLALLNAHKVEYLVVGAFALAHHGVPRFTGDLDILVKPDTDNARRILACLNEFGFASVGLEATDFTELDRVVQLGVTPVRVDILTSLTGVDWHEASSGKSEGDLGGVRVFYLGKNALLKNKKTLGRKKDMADIESLEDCTDRENNSAS